MASECPNCGAGAVGSTAVLLMQRGTAEKLTGVVCRDCDTVYVTEEEDAD